MSIYANAIETFIHVIESQKDLLTNQGISDLKKFANDLPEENEEIANKIELWLKADESRSKLFQAYLDELKAQPGTIDLYEKIQMFGHDDEDEEDEEQPERAKSRKPMLQNSIDNICKHAAQKDQNPQYK